MIRRFGAQPEPHRRYTLRPGVYAILPRGGAVLLTLQSQPQPEIQLPGGGIDPGESPVRALHREVMEETGWRIGTPRLLGRYRRFTFMPDYDLWAEKLCHIYLARPARADGPPSEPDHTVLWLPADEAAAALSNDGDGHFLRRYLY
ncbi:MAG: NUDIX hydrolase [Pseudomonadota bacterium]